MNAVQRRTFRSLLSIDWIGGRPLNASRAAADVARTLMFRAVGSLEGGAKKQMDERGQS